VTHHAQQIPHHNPLREHAFQGAVPGGAEAADAGWEHSHQCRSFRAQWG